MGYLLGRRKKLRTAMAVGAAIAAGRLSRDPMSFLQRGGELLGNSPVLGQVSGLSKPLAAAGKAAAAGVVSRQIDSMGDRIKRRTDALRTGGDETEPDADDEEQTESGADERAEHGGNGRAKGRPARESRADADDEYDEDDYDEEEDHEDEPEEEPRPATRRRAPQAKTNDGDGSPARRSGRSAPVRRRVSNR
jgi:hypothetical protein